MSQNQSLEDVMQRIRSRVDERNSGRPQLAGGMPSGSQGERELVKSDRRRVAPAELQIEANDLAPLQGEIATAIEGTRSVGQINPRNPGLHNGAIQLAKKVMRRSLTWYTRPLHYFQGGAIRALQNIASMLASHEHSLQTISRTISERESEFWHEIEVQDEGSVALREKVTSIDLQVTALAKGIETAGEELASVSSSVAEAASSFDQKLSLTEAEFKTKLARAQSILEERLTQMQASNGRQLAELGEALANVRSGVSKLSESLRESQTTSRLRDRNIRRMLYGARSNVTAPLQGESTAAVPAMFPSEVKQDLEFDYFAFEERYRGDEELIRARQQEYLQHYSGRENVLDVGCGRGEFLELLREKNISAKGVELGTDQYLLCLEKGLDVVQQDLFTYLESLPDESLGGLFSAQVIEHLTASDQLRYVALAYRKTKPSSPVIFETINAQCVWAVMRNFFLDPTHVRPVHPETLKFAMESAHFKNVALLFLNPMSDRYIPALECGGEVRNAQEFNQQLRHLNELLYGDQDYAAIGWH